MLNLRLPLCFLAALLSSFVAAQPSPKAQNIYFSSPKLAQVEPLYAFAEALEKAFGVAELLGSLEKTGLPLLLLPPTQTTWRQKGLAPDKPFLLQMEPKPLLCLGVANSKTLASAVDALPGEDKTVQKGSLHYRFVRSSPEHPFVVFWNASQLCAQPRAPAASAASLAKTLEATLASSASLLKTAAKHASPVASLPNNIRVHLEPVSPTQLKLRVNAANLPWKFQAAKAGKTALASVSADAGVLFKLHGIPAAEVFRYMDFVAALSPRGDALLSQKQTWFSRLPHLLADEFLVKIDYPQGRSSERLLLLAKLSPNSEAAFDAWLAELPGADASSPALNTKRGALSFGRKNAWAFASTSSEAALSLIEQLEKAKPASAPHFVGLTFPKTLSAFFQGDTFISHMLGLNSKQTRMLMFNLPLKNLSNTIRSVHFESRSLSPQSTELLVDISLVP